MTFKVTKYFLGLALIYATIGHVDIFPNDGKVYVDDEFFKPNTKGDRFYLHTGNNRWIETHTIHRDSTGLYSYEGDIKKSTEFKNEWEHKWKCPYCYQYWPIGKPCQNPSCPSKYK